MLPMLVWRRGGQGVRKRISKSLTSSPLFLHYILFSTAVFQKRNSSSANRSHLINPPKDIQYEWFALC